MPEPASLPALLDRLRRRGHPVRSVALMAGDVSRRVYHRVAFDGGATAVLALHPPGLRDACRRSLETGALLAGAGVRVAEVLDEDCDAGWLLLEDLGERTLYEHADRPWRELAGWFEDAIAAIGRIAALPRDEVAALNPPLDRDLLARELRQTREAFLEPLGLMGGLIGGHDLVESPAGSSLEAALDALCARLGAETPVPCHRDFGARNLMPLGEPGSPRVGVLDHQDLRLGPPAYDLASLLNDSLFPPPEDEERLLRLGLGSEGADGREAYHRAAAQRTLKAVGSYAAFARRGEGRHVGLVPPTLRRAVGHLARVPETAPLAPRLEELWQPA
ncbi:MAG TPA: phosphotransferase, partial [Thermoanaerobaculia bacterium]|nr:phosphotransferase [Thermoanaerobaculia bacterium]